MPGSYLIVTQSSFMYFSHSHSKLRFRNNSLGERHTKKLVLHNLEFPKLNSNLTEIFSDFLRSYTANFGTEPQTEPWPVLCTFVSVQWYSTLEALRLSYSQCL